MLYVAHRNLVSALATNWVLNLLGLSWTKGLELGLDRQFLINKISLALQKKPSFPYLRANSLPAEQLLHSYSLKLARSH